WSPGRDEAYVGVLIDDLISKGTDEPYRMFTSRAEFRTLLRQDNADIRLTALSNKIGLASQERLDKVVQKQKNVAEIKKILTTFNVEADDINPYFETIDSAAIDDKQKAAKIILRPNVSLDGMLQAIPSLATALETYDKDSIEQAEIQVKYETYIRKEEDLVEKVSHLENLVIPDTFDFEKLKAISSEAKQKFKKVRPRTLGQASRISGVSPSDIQILMVYMGR
ncbi:MAG: tRNA uridine-5-carboxymethylaminomethyl(34) synthesis enzyme MnmG, partial [Alphaproteobacteria bacterium]